MTFFANIGPVLVYFFSFWLLETNLECSLVRQSLKVTVLGARMGSLSTLSLSSE